MKWLSISLIAFLVLQLFTYTTASAQSSSTSLSIKDNLQVNNKISKDLTDSFQKKKEVTYLVKMKDQADTAKAAKNAAATAQKTDSSLTSSQIKRVKTSAVVTELKSTALESQQSLKKYLESATEKGKVSSYNSYYIVNAMAVTSNEEIMKEIAAMPEVEKVLPNRVRKLTPAEQETVKEMKLAKETNATEWNIDRVGAPEVWEEMGIDGSGVVVANIDTGVQWDHPALQDQYRGFDASNPDQTDHELNWFDATAGEETPYDDQGHGTHTMGTMVGTDDDGSNQIGVAPGAKWIAVKAFTAAGGTDADLLEAGEWVLAPKDADGTPHPEAAPDVVNNSWGGGPGLDEWYRPMVQNWISAGIIPVFSAGNDGPGDGTVAAPANYPEVIAVAATDSSDGLASFSSRGPSPYDGEIKPDIAAPGVNIRSSVPGSSYESGWNGTSMAGPHVAATAALLLQADSSLSVEDVKDILMETADTTTNSQYPEDPNEGFGHGIVNAFNAVSAVVSGVGEITGNVYKEGDDSEEPAIEHVAPEDTYEGVPLSLAAQVNDNVSVDTVELQYRLDGGDWETIAAELVQGDFTEGTYQAVIPGEAIAGDSLEYKWKAVDFGENEVETDVYQVSIKEAISTGYEEDFEANPVGWLSFGENNSWQWGVPESGPEEAASGENVYGTNLAGDYDNDANMTLVMPPVEVPEGDTFLQFKSWFNLENNYDYGHVVVSTDMESWDQLQEFNGTTEGWTDTEVDLSEYAGQNVFVGFHVDTDLSVVREGWYIDDVALTDQADGSTASLHRNTTKKAKAAKQDKKSADKKVEKKKKVNPKKLAPSKLKDVTAPQLAKGEIDDQYQPNLLPLDATVTVLETDRSVDTNPADGSFRLLHGAGDYTLQADAYGFYAEEQAVEVPEEGSVEANFTLNPIPTGTVSGQVVNEETGEPIEGATLMLVEDAAVDPVETGADGSYSIEAYEGDYTIRVMAPDFHAKEVAVSIEGDETVELTIEMDPFIGYPGEIGYDDGTAENARAFYDAGNGWAVKMSLAEGQESAMVTGGLFRFWTEDWPVPGGEEFQVAVYDASGPDGAPGEKLGGPYDATALRNGEWTRVDLADKGISVSGDFYMVYIQSQPNPNTPGLGTDEDGENAGRSWQLVDGGWSQTPESEGNYMIRALVSYAAEAPVIESPSDNSYTKEEVVTVTGSAAPSTTLTVYNNEEEAAVTEVNEDGEFSVDVTLESGANSLTAVSSTDNGSTDPSDPVVITLDQQKPELTITSPEDGEKTNKEVVKVTGEVVEDNLDKVVVNGQKADVDEDGAFSKRILVDDGENEIKVRAVDKAGNARVNTITIDAKLTAPEITNVTPEEDVYLQAGESVKIEFDSDADLDATFYIKMPLTNLSNNATELPMTETEDGHYVGYWTATSNVVAEGAEIVVKVGDDYGNVTEAAAEGKLFINTED
ncbi:S8 family serine peptidase [Sediminibacillus dalangtanensis]|uniref:S8 family serine peptidase n=1 Tax=Sediminibacillus dalangtanensis TaxID=2729421 RepID=A0ABX7VM94_9BACI|nr:S8 family peptidase [Sediminibacillus dalangtanensis]QTM97927.1 S8 family serine peptidase [Sediminibacillus dalangtanensis]